MVIWLHGDFCKPQSMLSTGYFHINSLLSWTTNFKSIGCVHFTCLWVHSKPKHSLFLVFPKVSAAFLLSFPEWQKTQSLFKKTFFDTAVQVRSSISLKQRDEGLLKSQLTEMWTLTVFDCTFTCTKIQQKSTNFLTLIFLFKMVISLCK